MLEDRGNVGGDEHLAVAEAERHAARIADAHRDEPIRLRGG